MSRDVVLGQIRGQDVTPAVLISLLETRDPDEVLGELDGEPLTVAEALRRTRRVAALPPVVPAEDRLPAGEWAEAVIVRGEAPYGRCPYCGTAKGVAGCLNLCEMPAAAAAEFNDGLREVLSRGRAATAWVEVLGGCTCGPANYSGYQTVRESHERDCPMGSRSA